MEENSRLEKQRHMSNTSFDTLTNSVRERKRRKAQRKKAQASYSVLYINWAVRKDLAESHLEAFLHSSLRYFGKFSIAAGRVGPMHLYGQLQGRKVRLKIWEKIWTFHNPGNSLFGTLHSTVHTSWTRGSVPFFPTWKWNSREIFIWRYYGAVMESYGQLCKKIIQKKKDKTKWHQEASMKCQDMLSSKKRLNIAMMALLRGYFKQTNKTNPNKPGEWRRHQGRRRAGQSDWMGKEEEELNHDRDVIWSQASWVFVPAQGGCTEKGEEWHSDSSSQPQGSLATRQLLRSFPKM